MYAIIKHSGKQYLIEQGDIVLLDRINDVTKDGELELKDVIMVNDGTNTVIGNPVIPDASVKIKVLGELKGKKVIIFKQKRRKNYRKKTGFKPTFTQVLVEDIIYQKN
ncbi:MAG: 50S ribosomal protein L21 [Deltaproteobacteria bacterium]|nr:50S ribosomal protein L21 [Deltaproteobacteria bacterium]MCL5792399.1 50S ribosomal protein L21 [Deltaproteobacteria bacterium]